MPRDLPVGNGALLVNFDSTGTLRDIYFPRVGQENHTSGHLCRFGVWVAEADGSQQWAVGQKDLPGREGTWRDAEDGQLSGNPVAQGSVDGVGGAELTLPKGRTHILHWWIAAGRTIGDVGDLDERMRERDPET